MHRHAQLLESKSERAVLPPGSLKSNLFVWVKRVGVLSSESIEAASVESSDSCDC